MGFGFGFGSRVGLEAVQPYVDRPAGGGERVARGYAELLALLLLAPEDDVPG